MKNRDTSTRDLMATARTLSVALPFLQKHDGQSIVVKLGGHAMGDPALMDDFAGDVALMKQCGVHPIVVHGGGPQIDDMLKRLEIESSFVDGLRVTDAATVEVVEMVLAGKINKEIVAAINKQGGRAVGLSGKDARLIVAEKLLQTVTDKATGAERKIDRGFVGKPVSINPEVLEVFRDSDLIPVVAPVAAGTEGETFNINGDTAAGALAGAMRAARLLLLTDVPGVKGADGALIEEMSVAEAQALIESGVIHGGMIPKVETALDALSRGVDAVVILDGRAPHAVLLELFTRHGAGTLIRR
jgi:acetylglutamate kinase